LGGRGFFVFIKSFLNLISALVIVVWACFSALGMVHVRLPIAFIQVLLVDESLASSYDFHV
jgi:hypothetical protein